MHNIPNAEMSPRIVNGVIRWYAGDTFELQLTLELEDQDGEAVTISPADTVKLAFLDRSLNTVREFSFTGITGNTVTMDFDAVCTALFPRGNYTYDVYLSGSNRTTLANDNKVVVE